MSEWIQNRTDSTKGAMFPRESGAVEVLALSGTDAYWLIKAITDPSFIDTLLTFFTDMTNAINSIYMFPFPLRVSGNRKQLQILGEDVKPYQRAVGAYKIDFNQYAEQHLLLYPTLIRPKNEEPHYYDYNGYTKIFIYLPFYGEVELMANDVMNKYVQVTWSMSSISGQIMYFILVGDSPSPVLPNYPMPNVRLIGKYECNIAVEVPIGATNKAAVNRNIIMAAANTVTAIATAGVSMGLTSAGIGMSTANSTVTQSTRTRARSPEKGSRLKVTGETAKETTINRTSNVPISRQILSAVENVASSTMSALNNSVLRSQSEITKNPVLEQFGSHTVKISIYRPRLLEAYHSRYVGLPLNEIGRIGAHSGFTKVSEVHLENFPAEITFEELNEIRDILINGFILT